jgi:hypothetical protein
MMPGKLLTVASTIQCQHGGMVLLTTGNARVKAGGAFALLESDVSTVVGCPFAIGPKYSPCVRIQWTAPSVKVKAGAAVLVSSSIGICYSPESAPQGVAIIANTQPKVSAQ